MDSNSEKQNNVYSRSSIDGFKTIFLLFYTSKILQIKLHTSILHNKQHTSPQLFSLIFQASLCRFTLRLLAWVVWILDGLKTIFSLLRWGVYVMFLSLCLGVNWVQTIRRSLKFSHWGGKIALLWKQRWTMADYWPLVLCADSTKLCIDVMSVFNVNFTWYALWSF